MSRCLKDLDLEFPQMVGVVQVTNIQVGGVVQVKGLSPKKTYLECNNRDHDEMTFKVCTVVR